MVTPDPRIENRAGPWHDLWRVMWPDGRCVFTLSRDAAYREAGMCAAPGCWHEYGTPCGKCPKEAR